MNAFTTAFAAKVAQLQAEARDNHYKKSRQTAEYLGDITFDAVSMINARYKSALPSISLP
ncbi:hypothetical protein EBR96_05130 [bacterium]|nr:hypothetical protein [bacterium]